MVRQRYQSTKMFDNFSIAIRQWKAQHSHCSLLHGYHVKAKVWFEHVDDTLPLEKQLDEMNWIVDYALFGRNGLKDWMNSMFDHTTIIEEDDPQLESFKYMEELGTCKLVVVKTIGAEAMAKLIFDKFKDVLSKTEGGRVKPVKVEFWEADKNSSIYYEQYTHPE